jgi:hypothetical protein
MPCSAGGCTGHTSMNAISMAINCGICGEPRHNGGCAPILKRLLAEARARIAALELLLSNSMPAQIDSSLTGSLTVRHESNAKFDKTAYQRAYMREYRAGKKVK